MKNRTIFIAVTILLVAHFGKAEDCIELVENGGRLGRRQLFQVGFDDPIRGVFAER